MKARRNRGARAALLSLEAEAVSARGGFACLFSTSDEYEAALISERRAQGRYRYRHPRGSVTLYGLIYTGIVLLFG